MPSSGGDHAADRGRREADQEADASAVEESCEDVTTLVVRAQEVVGEVPRRTDRRDAQSEALRIGLQDADGPAAESDASLEVGREGVDVRDEVGVHRGQQADDRP